MRQERRERHNAKQSQNGKTIISVRPQTAAFKSISIILFLSKNKNPYWMFSVLHSGPWRYPPICATGFILVGPKIMSRAMRGTPENRKKAKPKTYPKEKTPPTLNKESCVITFYQSSR